MIFAASGQESDKDNSLSLSYKAIYQPHQALDSIPDAGVPDAEESVILLFAVPIDEEMRH